MRTEFLCTSVFRVASRTSALKPPMVYSTDHSKAVVPVLVLLCVAMLFIV